ncbi:cytochrome P450 [Pyrenochaeta sp. MPI-SDFR-AT-0127]|nr:cytochrome P450 [Pyrenochaeta sp. MPI-SDFR-AT-0127]
MAKVQGESLFTPWTIAASILTYWIAATVYNLLRSPQPPKSIPWMGHGKGWLAAFRNFTALTKSKEWLLAGYDKYSKKNKIFVLPATLGMQAEVVMPRTQLSWMFDQPDHILSTSEAHYEFLQGDYCFVKPIILKNPYHEHVIHKNLVRNLNAILPDLEDEVPHAVAEVYGTDTDTFKKIEILESFMKMIPGLTNRMLVGQPLCRERKFLNAVLAFTMDVIRTQSILLLAPKALHPIVGNLLSLTTKLHYWQSSRWTLPLIKQRISDIARKEAGDPEYKSWTEPSDFVTWSYRTALAEGRVDEAQPDRIAQRIMPINFASIHTTSLTAYETMINILSADSDVVESLREEAHHILQEEGGWTKQGLSKMHRIDSAIRESQRVAPIALTFVHRKVVAKGGITSPEGIFLPYGTLLSCPWTPIAGDTELHERPEEFDAFRYSRAREAFDSMSAEEKVNVDALKLKQTGLVTTGIHHLPFGHGRHACPGRFFVSHELKMIFAHLLLNYDFKPLKQKPTKLWVIRFQIPLPVHIEVRRRKSIWTPETRS